MDSTQNMIVHSEQKERLPDNKDVLTRKILHLLNLKSGDKFDIKNNKIIHSWHDHLIRYMSNNDGRENLLSYIQNIVSDLMILEKNHETEDLKDKLLEIIIILKQTYRKDSLTKSCLEAEMIKLKKY